MKTKIQINSVETVNGQIQVVGTVDPEGSPIDFVATTFRWGSKMLMKVNDQFMDRGTRIAVGHAAKKAIRSLGLEIPKAELKRPRKTKVEVVSSAASEPAADGPVPEVELLSLDEAVEALEA